MNRGPKMCSRRLIHRLRNAFFDRILVYWAIIRPLQHLVASGFDAPLLSPVPAPFAVEAELPSLVSSAGLWDFLFRGCPRPFLRPRRPEERCRCRWRLYVIWVFEPVPHAPVPATSSFRSPSKPVAPIFTTGCQSSVTIERSLNPYLSPHGNSFYLLLLPLFPPRLRGARRGYSGISKLSPAAGTKKLESFLIESTNWD